MYLVRSKKPRGYAIGAILYGKFRCQFFDKCVAVVMLETSRLVRHFLRETPSSVPNTRLKTHNCDTPFYKWQYEGTEQKRILPVLGICTVYIYNFLLVESSVVVSLTLSSEKRQSTETVKFGRVCVVCEYLELFCAVAPSNLKRARSDWSRPSVSGDPPTLYCLYLDTQSKFVFLRYSL